MIEPNLNSISLVKYALNLYLHFFSQYNETYNVFIFTRSFEGIVMISFPNVSLYQSLSFLFFGFLLVLDIYISGSLNKKSSGLKPILFSRAVNTNKLLSSIFLGRDSS